MKRRVLLDVDGVIADFVAPVVEWAQSFGDFRRDQITSYDILEAFGLKWATDHLDALCGSPGFVADIPVVPGAREFVDRLRKNFEVVCVTSPYEGAPAWAHERTQWLIRHFNLPSRDVIFCKRKDLIRGDVLIEDALHNLTSFPGVRVLIDQPWNRSGELVNACRAYSLTEAAAWLEGRFGVGDT